jgi:aspartokinase
MYQGWSVSKAVRHLVSFNKGYRQALEEGYANISALSRLIKPSVESMLGREVTIDSIITSLKRMRAVAKPPSFQAVKVLARSRLEVRTGIAKVTVKKNSQTKRIARDLATSSLGFFQLLDGVTSITLIVDLKNYEEVRQAFLPAFRISENTSMAALLVISPPKIAETPGVLSLILEHLARHEINVEEVVSCHTDTIILVRGVDGGRGFDVIHNLIALSKRLVQQR